MGATSDDTRRSTVATVSVTKLEQGRVRKGKFNLRGHLKKTLAFLLVTFYLMLNNFNAFIRCDSLYRIHAQCIVSSGFRYLMCDMFRCLGYKNATCLGACERFHLHCKGSSDAAAVQARLEAVMRTVLVEYHPYTGAKAIYSDRENCEDLNYYRGWMDLLDINHKWER